MLIALTTALSEWKQSTSQGLPQQTGWFWLWVEPPLWQRPRALSTVLRYGPTCRDPDKYVKEEHRRRWIKCLKENASLLSNLASNNHREINHLCKNLQTRRSQGKKAWYMGYKLCLRMSDLVHLWHYYIPKWQIIFFRLWRAPDKWKTWQRHTDKQEIEWEGDINASANKQSYKDLHCIVPRKKANPELSKEKLKCRAGSKAV